MSYQARHDTNAVVRLSDNMIIGPEHSEEWTEYQAWLAEGNIPEDAPPVIEEPVVLDAKEKLARAGLSVDELKELLGIK